jgi:hypothetical protein
MVNKKPCLQIFGNILFKICGNLHAVFFTANLRILYCIPLLILILCTSMLLVSPAAAPASAHFLGEERKETLCGRLVFLQDSKTGENLIGLAPCGQTQPIIFSYRPSELHDYYRLHDVVIKQGPAVATLNFGRITSYITKFSASFGIQDCNDCKLRAATWTPQPAQASLNCADWIIETSAGLAASQAPELSQGDAIRFQTNEYAAGAELRQKCQGDETCRAQAVAIFLGGQLGAIFQKNQLPAETVIQVLKKLLSDPQQAKSCAASPQSVWDMIVGLDQQGYSIQGLQASTPLTQLIEDFAGRRTGILPDGTLSEEIPGSALVVAGRSKYTLLVAGSAAKISLRGNDNGALELKVIDFSDGNVLLAAFSRPGITNKTLCKLALAGEASLVQLDMLGDGVVAPLAPAKTTLYPIVRPWLATFTPGVLLATDTPQPTSSETAAPPILTASPAVPSLALTLVAPTGTSGAMKGETPVPTSRIPLPCGSAVEVGLAGVAVLWTRKKRSPQSHREHGDRT